MTVPAPPPVPREHGAWTMLAIPMVLGLAAGGFRSTGAWLIPFATALVFLAHHAIIPLAQRTRDRKTLPPGYAPRRLLWGVAYLIAAALVFAGAVLAAEPSARGSVLTIAGAAALLAAIYAIAASLGHARAILFESLGLAGISLSGPMMAACAGRPFDRSLFGPAVLSLGYFLSSVAFVRGYERGREERRAALGAGGGANVGIAMSLAGAAAWGVLPEWWWVAFVPVTVRTAWGIASPPSNLRALGMREIWVALAFTSIVAAIL